MENQPITNPSDISSTNPIAVSQPPTQSQTKINVIVPVLVTLLVSAILFGFGGYYLGKTSSQPTENSPKNQAAIVVVTPTPLPSSIPATSEGPESTWQSYTNFAALYEVQYPNGWRVVPYSSGEGYGPKEIGEDVLWGINFYDKANYTLEQVTAEFGKQFSDRRQTKQNIMVSNLSATKYVTTTASIADWYSESIVIERGTSYIVISNGAITNENLQKMRGVAPDTTFEKFYNSFHFVN